MAVPLVLAVVVAACTSGGSTDGVRFARRRGRRATSSSRCGWATRRRRPQNQSYEFLSLQKIVDAYNASQSDAHITMQYVNSDFALQKATVALQGDKAPDISYQYGTNMPQLAQSPEARRPHATA